MGDRASRWLVVTLFAVVGLGAMQAAALARHNFSMLQAEPQVVVPGDQVTVSGFSYTETAVVRFGALDGPVLTRLEPTPNEDIEGTVRIPRDTAPGRYIVFAMHEDGDGEPARFPGQAAVTVVGPGGAPLDLSTGLEIEPRPAGLVVGDSAGVGQLALVALAAAGAVGAVAMVLFGLVSPPRSARATRARGRR